MVERLRKGRTGFVLAAGAAVVSCTSLAGAGPCRIGVAPEPVALAAGDLDGDGLDDVAVASDLADRVTLLFAAGAGRFATPEELIFGRPERSEGLRALVVVDLDADGDLDLAAAASLTDTVWVARNQGGRVFSAPQARRAGSGADRSYPLGLAAADLDGDGRTDLAVANHLVEDVAVLFGRGDLEFDPPARFGVRTPRGESVLFYRSKQVEAADTGGGGRPDLVVSNHDAGSVTVLRNLGGGDFGEPREFPAAAHTSTTERLAVADLDGDGVVDLAAVSTFPPVLSVLLSGPEGFAAPVEYATGALPSAVAAGDLDGDGDADLAVTVRSADSLEVFLNRGDGIFVPGNGAGVGCWPVALALADLDGDGDADVVVANRASSDVSVLVNTGGGRFAGCSPSQFLRGNADGNCSVNLTDAVFLLAHLFKGGPRPPCPDAADADDTGLLNLTDPIYLLNHLFRSGPRPPPPYPDYGEDPTPDGLECSGPGGG